MKRLLTIVYWSMPILYCWLWLFINELPSDIYYQLSETVQSEYIESHKYMMFAPIFVPFILASLYVFLYIERRLLRFWRWVLAFNLALLAYVLYNSVRLMLLADEWHHFMALEWLVQEVPFLVVLCVVQLLMRKYELPFLQRCDKWYALFYTLPLLWVAWMFVLDFVLGFSMCFSGFLLFPFAAFHLWLHKKWIGRKPLLYGVSAVLFLAMFACVLALRPTMTGIIFIAFYFAPWFFAAPFVSKRHLS